MIYWTLLKRSSVLLFLCNQLSYFVHIVIRSVCRIGLLNAVRSQVERYALKYVLINEHSLTDGKTIKDELKNVSDLSTLITNDSTVTTRPTCIDRAICESSMSLFSSTWDKKRFRSYFFNFRTNLWLVFCCVEEFVVSFAVWFCEESNLKTKENNLEEEEEEKWYYFTCWVWRKRSRSSGPR